MSAQADAVLHWPLQESSQTSDLAAQVACQHIRFREAVEEAMHTHTPPPPMDVYGGSATGVGQRRTADDRRASTVIASDLRTQAA